MAGERIANRYELLDKLGEDLVSEQFRGRDSQTNREVVIKLLQIDPCRRSPENLFRYRRVMRELALLRHPNLCAVIDQGEWKDREYVVLESHSAARLAGRAGGPMEPSDALPIMLAVCRGLDAAHQKAIMHGLLNPDSVVLEPDGTAKLSEFGTGLLLELTRIRERSDVLRIFGYLAPEQSGILRRPADLRSDLYSMGILFYELLAGSPPYRSEEANILISEHVSRTPESLRRLNPKIPEVLEKIIFKLIAKDPDDRYQTAGGVLADLEIHASLQKEGREQTQFEIGLNDRLRKPSFATRLIGRESELNRLRETVDAARQGRGKIVFIHGEPGIGKTRLINELRADVHALGGLFIGGKCSQYDAGTPFKVLSMTIESYVERVRRLSSAEQASHVQRIRESVGELGAEIVKLTPKIKNLIGDPAPLASIEPNQQRVRFMVTTVNFLASIGSPEQSLVVFLDDLQWSDEGSCELLERLAPKLQDRGVTLIICYRDSEVDASHPLARLQGSLQQNGIEFGDIAVKPFEADQTREIVGRVLLEPPERVETLAEYLSGRTQGNPFFILELLRMMVEEEVVSYQDGQCRFDPARLEKVNLPENIVEVVLRRIRDLSEADLQVLSFAAVIGKQVELGLLSTLTHRHVEELVGSIDRAIDQQVLARGITEEQSVSFVHDRVREAFYSRVKDVGSLHRQIAEALERQNPDASGHVVYDLAYHYTRGGVTDKAIAYSLQAAETAAQSSAHDIAIDLYEKARKILEETGRTRDCRYVDLLESLGEAYRISGHFDEALDVLERCKRLIPGPDALRRASVLAKMGDAYFEKGEPSRAAVIIEQALRELGMSVPRGRKMLLAATAWEFCTQLYHIVRPTRLCRGFRPLNERETVIARLMDRLAYVHYFSDVERTFYFFLRALNLCENRAPSRMLAAQYALAGAVWTALPWFWKARRDLNCCLEMSRDFQDSVQEARAYTYLSFAYRMMNRPREAVEVSNKAIRMLKRLGEYYDLGAAYVFRNHANEMVMPIDQSILENREFLDMTKDTHLAQQLCWSLGYDGYLKIHKGEITDPVIRDLREGIRIGREANDKPSALLCEAFLAYGYLRQKNFDMALSTVRHIESLIPTHSLGACWIMEIWTTCAEVYLELIANTPNASEETLAEYFEHARASCRDALRRSRSYPYITGWAYQVNGTLCWLRGQSKQARRFWEQAIHVLRRTDSLYRLACVLREAGRWMLKQNPSDRRAQEHLMEAKDLFLRYGCPKEAAETSSLLQGPAGRGVHRTREALTFKRHLQSLLSVTQAIGSVFDIEELLEQIVTYAMEVTGAERGCILLNSEANHLELRVGRGWSRDLLDKPFSYEGYGISLALVEQSRQRTQATIAGARDDGEIGTELSHHGVRQAMCIPLRTQEKDIGILYLDNHLADGVFGGEELELMKSFAVQATVSIENTRLVQSFLEQDRLKQELRLGRDIQQGFLPKEAPKVEGLRVAAVMDPAREIGGDYYDFILRPSSNGSAPLAIVIGDVTGKGLGAGLNMAMVKTTLLTLSREPIGLKEILIKANRILHGQMSFGTFISLLYLQWDPASKTMSCAGAGHCEILIFRKATGRVEVVHAGGTALGLVPDIRPKLEERNLPLEPADKIVLYTDGLVEAQNPAGEEYGMARLSASLERAGGLPPDQIVDVLRRDVKEFIESASQYDDITVIVMEAQ